MPGLSAGKLVEAGLWLGFAVGAWALSYRFEQPIEIYRFGATGWPRVVAALIALAAIGQLVQRLRGTEPPAPIGPVPDAQAGTEPGGVRHVLHVAAMLLLPVAYAASLDYTGFYVTTPVFLLLFLLVVGERRPRFLIAVPLAIYALLLLCFTRLLYVGLPVGNWHPFYDVSHALLALLR